MVSLRKMWRMVARNARAGGFATKRNSPHGTPFPHSGQTPVTFPVRSYPHFRQVPGCGLRARRGESGDHEAKDEGGPQGNNALDRSSRKRHPLER